MNSNKYIHSRSLHPIICTILKYHHWCCNQKENYHSVPNFDFLWLKPSPINVEKSQKKNKVKSHNRFKKSLIRSKIRWRFFSCSQWFSWPPKKWWYGLRRSPTTEVPIWNLMCPTSLRYQLFLVQPLTHRANCKITAVLPTAYLVAEQSEALYSFGPMNKLLLFKTSCRRG